MVMTTLKSARLLEPMPILRFCLSHVQRSLQKAGCASKISKMLSDQVVCFLVLLIPVCPSLFEKRTITPVGGPMFLGFILNPKPLMIAPESRSQGLFVTEFMEKKMVLSSGKTGVLNVWNVFHFKYLCYSATCLPISNLFMPRSTCVLCVDQNVPLQIWI